MHLSDITDAFINRKFGQKIVARGFEYFHNGSVENAILRGDTLTAEVAGSEDEPYRVLIGFGAKDISGASCTCPYGGEWGGWCKHIAAVLLVCAHESEEIRAATPLDALLVALDRDGLETVLLRLAKSEPEIAEKIAEEAERLLVVPPSAKPVASSVARTLPMPDASALRVAVQRILREPDEGWNLREARAIRGKISELFEKQVAKRLKAGDAKGALLALEPLTDEYVHHWFDVDAIDDLSDFFPAVGEFWQRTIAASKATLTPAMRGMWKTKLDAWESELTRYGIEETFADAISLLLRR